MARFVTGMPEDRREFLEATADMFFRRKNSNLIQAVIAIAFLILGGSNLRHLSAQTDTARIQGSVLDQTGAAIPGATVTLSNVDTGTSTTATSDGTGSFTFNALVRGNYKAQVQASGFESQNQSMILEVSQVQALTFHLKQIGRAHV